MDYVFIRDNTRYYQLSRDIVVPILSDFSWNKAGKVLLGKEYTWPLQTDEWHQIDLNRIDSYLVALHVS